MPNPNQSAEKLDDSATLSMDNALIVEPIKKHFNITALDPLSNVDFLAKFVLSIISGALIVITFSTGHSRVQSKRNI